MNFFDCHPEFIDSDLRKTRGTTQVTSESLSKRCAVLLPKWSIEGMRVLDLGHCVGAMGHWALANGAAHYTGVDIQEDFCEVSNTLLGNYWESNQYSIVDQDVMQFMRDRVAMGTKYDVVLASGIMHGYINSVGFIELMSKLSTKYIVVESQEVDEGVNPTIAFKVYNMLSNVSGCPYMGWTSVIGFNALRTVMGEYGFNMHGDRIYPEKITGTHDAYNDSVILNQDKMFGTPQRFMVRYTKASGIVKNSLGHKITNNIQKFKPGYINKDNLTIEKAPVWEFDKSVADRFQAEALCNIPDYDRIIDMCLDIANRKYDQESVIVDVGSALGYTMAKFTDAGYINVHGVESSQAMIDAAEFSSSVILSDKFPSDFTCDMVMANWTLHFVNERKEYIQAVYNALNVDGTFILSDKTPQTPTVKELYYDFKRKNGITDEYIYEKEQKLKGYMNLLPIEWYMETLRDIGFKNIQIINGRFGFITFYVEK